MTSNSSTSQKSNIITPIKSKIDAREYRILTLTNGLECCIISDPTTEKAAAAMNVSVGHFADPDETPGLAHFLEHMLFLGTKKYPDESEYAQFITDNGGHDNASTGMHRTCYQFDIHADHLYECLDRFAQFFIAPLFTESATGRELNAVDSENAKNLQNDAWRQFQFNKSLAKPSHPYSKFGSGNMNTLKNNLPADYNLREKLLQFHKLYYSSSIMKLCILGKQSLDELQQFIETLFTQIPNTNRVPPSYSTDAFDVKSFPKLYKIVPVKEQRTLKIAWVLPSVYNETESWPHSFMSHLLGDEGQGSVLAYLKSKDWATALCAGAYENIPEFLLFEVSINLTVEGLQNWTQVVTAVYQYLHAIQSMTDEEWRRDWEERRKVRQMSFDFQNKASPYGYVTSIARMLMRNYKREHFLEHLKRILFKCDIPLYKKTAVQFSTDNMVIQIISKDFESECNEVEKWYSTKFQTCALEPDLLNEWQSCGINKEVLHIPPENKYIADDFTLFYIKDNLKKQDEFDECRESPPELLQINDQFRVWFKQDAVFDQPKLWVAIEFISMNKIFDDNSVSKLETKLILEILDDELSLYTYAFDEAGLSKSISTNDSENSIILEFGGYNQKLHLLMETVIQMLANLEISKNKFDVQFEKLKRGLESRRKQQPYNHCFQMRSFLLQENTASLNMLFDAYNKITFESVKRKYEQMFKNGAVQKGFQIKAFIYGNANKQSIKPYVECIETHLCSKNNDEFKSQALDKKGCLKIPTKSDSKPIIVEFDGPNKDDQNSCCENVYFYRTELNSTADLGVLSLFKNICHAACFDQLRTKEQLGYIVWSYDTNYKGSACWKVVVQSAKQTAKYLNFRVESFIQNNIQKLIDDLTDESLQVNKKGVINNLLEKPKRLKTQFNRYWSEISLNRFEWTRRTKIAKAVEIITPKDVEKFYNTYVHRSSLQRCKLSIQLQTLYDFSKDKDDSKTESAANENDKDKNKNKNKDGDADVAMKDEKETKVKNDDVALEKEMNDGNNFCAIGEVGFEKIKQTLGYFDYPWKDNNSKQNNN